MKQGTPPQFVIQTNMISTDTSNNNNNNTITNDTSNNNNNTITNDTTTNTPRPHPSMTYVSISLLVLSVDKHGQTVLSPPSYHPIVTSDNNTNNGITFILPL